MTIHKLNLKGRTARFNLKGYTPILGYIFHPNISRRIKVNSSQFNTKTNRTKQLTPKILNNLTTTNHCFDKNLSRNLPLETSCPQKISSKRYSSQQSSNVLSLCIFS